jgi:hypothetical protein
MTDFFYDKYLLRTSTIMWLFIIDLIDGKITEKERQEMREMLLKITK